jgi:lipoprotein-anchoring transpeptidase ErfK/SrfK
MRQQYRRVSFSAWVFWGALIVGGTFYGAYRFDWFDVNFLLPASARSQVADGKKAPAAEKAAEKTPAQAPPAGQIEVAQSPAGPQSEPQPAEFDEPAPFAKTEKEKFTKARLLQQRAEAPPPKLLANSPTTSSVQPANVADIEASRSPFSLDAPSAAAPPAKTPAKPNTVVQAVNVAEEKEMPPVDPELAAHLDKIDQFLQNSDLLRAHRELSTLYWAKPRWRASIHERIEKSANAIYFDPEPQFLQPYVVKAHDQFAVFAKQYNVPWQYLARLNHVDPKKIRPGQQLKVIKGPFSAIIELNNFVLTLHAYGYYVRAYPIGIGKDGATPLGKFTVLNKVTNPQYTDPEGHVIEGADPNNPLGVRWLDLGKGYGIHGTIAPNSIGKAESRGCIRLRNEDVEEVYDMLALGSEVTIRR